jgi:hypothetical protein
VCAAGEWWERGHRARGERERAENADLVTRDGLLSGLVVRGGDRWAKRTRTDGDGRDGVFEFWARVKIRARLFHVRLSVCLPAYGDIARYYMVQATPTDTDVPCHTAQAAGGSAAQHTPCRVSRLTTPAMQKHPLCKTSFLQPTTSHGSTRRDHVVCIATTGGDTTDPPNKQPATNSPSRAVSSPQTCTLSTHQHAAGAPTPNVHAYTGVKAMR